MNSRMLGTIRAFVVRSQLPRALLSHERAALNHHPIHTLTQPSATNATKRFKVPLTLALYQPLKNQPHRMISDWNQKRSNFSKSKLEIVVINVCLGVFLIYFLWLREPNDIDESMSRPIWERLPGIDPERAEQMMELDRRLGLQVDKAGLEKYKKEYYAHQLALLEQEKEAEERHRKLRTQSQNRNYE